MAALRGGLAKSKSILTGAKVTQFDLSAEASRFNESVTANRVFIALGIGLGVVVAGVFGYQLALSISGTGRFVGAPLLPTALIFLGVGLAAFTAYTFIRATKSPDTLLLSDSEIRFEGGSGPSEVIDLTGRRTRFSLMDYRPVNLGLQRSGQKPWANGTEYALSRSQRTIALSAEAMVAILETCGRLRFQIIESGPGELKPGPPRRFRVTTRPMAGH